MKMNCFEDSTAWQKAQELAVWVYTQFNDHRDYGFKNQICRAVVSISNNFVEGFDRKSDKEFLYFLYISRGSNSEVKSMLYLAEKLNYIDSTQRTEGINRCEEIGKKLNSLISYLLQSNQQKD
ncbi:MAG: four helix bundle protein [Saprospiraceae bacterium]|nr:four helix bundle protein [Saprospiraceae bacterium]